MKILIINDRSSGGGAEQYLGGLIEELRHNGHRTRTIVFDSGGSRGIADHSLPYSDHVLYRGLTRYGFNPYYYYRLRKLIASFEPDVIHIHNNFNTPLPVLRIARPYPTLRTVHDSGDVSIEDATQYRGTTGVSRVMPTLERLFRPVLWRARNRAIDCYITPSTWLKNVVAEKTDKKTVRVYNYSEDIEPAFGGDYVLFVGRLSEAKGPGLLVDALSRFDSPPQTKIVGSGPLANDLQRRIDREGLRERVSMLGFVEQERLHDLYQSARFVVVPSRWRETFGLVVTEALASGTPVVVAKKGSLPELVRDGREGLHFEPGDAHDLYERMSAMTEANTEQMGRRARERFESNFRRTDHVDRLLELYRECRDGDATGSQSP